MLSFAAHRSLFCAAAPTTALPADARDESHPPRFVIHFHCTPCCIIIIPNTRVAQLHWAAARLWGRFAPHCPSHLHGPPLSPVHTSPQCNGAVRHTGYPRVRCHRVHQRGSVPVCHSAPHAQFLWSPHFRSLSHFWISAVV